MARVSSGARVGYVSIRSDTIRRLSEVCVRPEVLLGCKILWKKDRVPHTTEKWCKKEHWIIRYSMVEARRKKVFHVYPTVTLASACAMPSKRTRRCATMHRSVAARIYQIAHLKVPPCKSGVLVTP